MTFYEVTFKLHGHGKALIEADSLEEAQDKADERDFLPLSEVCLEWEHDDITDVEEIA